MPYYLSSSLSFAERLLSLFGVRVYYYLRGTLSTALWRIRSQRTGSLLANRSSGRCVDTTSDGAATPVYFPVARLTRSSANSAPLQAFEQLLRNNGIRSYDYGCDSLDQHDAQPVRCHNYTTTSILPGSCTPA